jgi:hypothetical protein
MNRSSAFSLIDYHYEQQRALSTTSIALNALTRNCFGRLSSFFVSTIDVGDFCQPHVTKSPHTNSRIFFQKMGTRLRCSLPIKPLCYLAATKPDHFKFHLTGSSVSMELSRPALPVLLTPQLTPAFTVAFPVNAATTTCLHSTCLCCYRRHSHLSLLLPCPTT